VRPLDFTERVLSFNFRGDQNKVNGENEYGNRYSFAYIDQFADNRLGISIGYAHMDSPQPGFQNESWGYADGPNGTKVYGGGKLYHFDDALERDGWMGTLQWKPNDWYEGTIDLFYSQFKKTEVKTGLEFGTQWGGNPQPILQPGYTTNGNGTITSSDWTNVKPVIRMDSNPIDDELLSWGWNNKFKINDHWSLTGDISFSRTNRDFDFLETYAGLIGGPAGGGGGLTTAHVELDPSGEFYNITFGTDLNDPSNLQLIDAGGWGQDGYLKAFNVNDRLWAYRVDAERKFDTGWLSSIEFGLNITDRDKHKSSDEAKLCLVACLNNIDSAPFPGSPGDFGFGGLDGLATYDAEQLLASGIYHLQPKFHPDIAKKNWSIAENLTTLYAQFNIDTDIGDMPLRGNFGFQYVTVDQSSEGFSTFDGNDAGELSSAGAKYHDFLPNLNLNLGLPWEMQLRFAAARQMARPRLEDLRASADVGIRIGGFCPNSADVCWAGGGGNPRLRPWLANAYDLSWEKYFTTEAGNKGYVAAAYWFKDLQTYIFKADIPFDYDGYALPPPDPTDVVGVTYPDSTLGVLNGPFNGEGGTMKGLELSASLPLDVLWHGLNGFGLQASYSDTTSAIEPFGPGSTQPLPGLSKYVSNLTVYWERWGFSIRASQRTRSQFLGETRGFGAENVFVLINGEKVRDVQVNYSFQPGSMLEGLSLYLQVSNIGDEPFTTSDAGDPGARPLMYFEYGRTTLAGFSYKF
jgi:iron complex outermembrane receptor protein